MNTQPVIASKAKQSIKWLERAFLAVLAVPFIIHGSTKPSTPATGTVTFLRTDADVQYFTDRGSYTTNDYVYVDFTTHPIVPPSANFYGEYRELAATNETDWVEIVNTTIGDFSPPQSIAFPNATNYNWRFYTDWTPGPSVVTNGVLHVNWGVPVTPQSPDTVIGLPVRTELELQKEAE